MRHKHDQFGFTLIELLIASSVFSVILLMLAFGLLRIGRVYYKAVNMSRTQSALRAISDDVIQAVQYGGGNITSPTGSNPYSICIGDRRYSYRMFNQASSVDDPAHNKARRVLIAEKIIGACTAPTLPGLLDANANITLPTATSAEELVPQGMRLLQFSVLEKAVGSGVYNVDIKLAFGDSDLLSGNGLVANSICKGGAGQQFCATSEMHTTIRRKVVQ